jgi:hypothetical protein
MKTLTAILFIILTLFSNAIADDDLRDFNPSRPNRTDSPYTIDPEHFQIEASFSEWTWGNGTRVWNVAPFELRYGITKSLEGQILYSSYFSTSKGNGFGDTTLRLEYNLWGNDSGATCLSIIPFLKIPSNTGIGNSYYEGGAEVTYAIKLPCDWELDFSHGVAALNGNGYYSDFVNVTTLTHSLFLKELAGFVELYSEVSTHMLQGWNGAFDFGVTYLIAKNVQIDAACYIGVTQAADPYHFLTGITYRY